VALHDRWQHSTCKNSLGALASKTKNDGNSLQKTVKWLLKSFPVGARGCLRYLQMSADPLQRILNFVTDIRTTKNF
jgi:hypothetical protein